MPTSTFLTPRLVGARFDGHEIPLELLRDFSILEEFVIEVAKWHFLRAHPDRVRSPRGFLQGVSLRLSGIEAGSAIPQIVLSLAATAAPLLFDPELAHLEQSRDSIIAAIAAAQHGSSPTDHLPEKLLWYFEFFGRSLRDDEAIEFPFRGDRARLTKETRRRLLGSIKNMAVTDTMAVVGKIPEADQEKGTFQLQVGADQRFPSKEFSRHREVVLQAFNGYSDGVQVRVRGLWRFGQSNELLGIEEVESVEIVDPLDVPLRVKQLEQLQDGWFDGEGRSLSAEGTVWFSAAFEANFSARLALPHLYPTLSGGIRAEWSLSGRDASLEVDLENRKAEWHELELSTDAEDSRSLLLSSTQDWEWIVNRVTELGGVQND